LVKIQVIFETSFILSLRSLATTNKVSFDFFKGY